MNVALLESLMASAVINPVRAIVNNEAAFIKDRLNKAGEYELASQYWSWSCSRYRVPEWMNDRIEQMQDDLEAIDKQQTMPSWGTYGT